MYRLLVKIPLVLSIVFAGRTFALQGESIFVKGILGGGYSSLSETAQDITVSLSGISGMGFIQAGGSLTKSIKLFAFTSVTYTPKPSVKLENLKIDTAYNYLTCFDLGIGVAYYLRSGQSISLGGSVASAYAKYNVYSTDIGWYARHGWGSHVIISQEFPMSPKLSVGINLIGYYGTIYDVGPAPFADSPITNMYFGLGGSLMYD